MACINRSVEDVESLIEFAKLSSSSLLHTTQTLEFPDHYDPQSTTLMQLPDKLLSVLKKGDRLVLRGEPEDFAVLCTDTETYEVREAETSNSLVLIPGLLLPSHLTQQQDNRTLLNKEVAGIHYKYLEVRECVPRLNKLRTLLAQAPYSGPQHDADDCEEARQYSFSELLERVQCSDEQMREALDALPAVHIGGHWRVLELDYQFKVVSDVLALLEERSWSIDAVPRDQVLVALSQVEPRPVLHMCLEYYFKPSVGAGAGDDGEGQLLRIYDDRLSRLFAEVLLKPAGKFNLAEFLTIWQQSVPPGVVTALQQLSGLALVDSSSSPAVVWLYPASSLSEDPQQRFAALFALREAWAMADIAPYVRDLSSSQCSVNSLLAKHCRTSSQKGIKYYSAKHTR